MVVDGEDSGNEVDSLSLHWVGLPKWPCIVCDGGWIIEHVDLLSLTILVHEVAGEISILDAGEIEYSGEIARHSGALNFCRGAEIGARYVGERGRWRNWTNSELDPKEVRFAGSM